MRSAVIGTAGLVVASAGVASYYATRPPSPRADVVRAVYDLAAPTWSVLFGLVAVGLAVTVFAGRWARVAHVVAMGAFLAYSAALWLGAFSVSPPSSWVGASLSLALAAHAYVLARHHAWDDAWTRH